MFPLGTRVDHSIFLTVHYGSDSRNSDLHPSRQKFILCQHYFCRLAWPINPGNAIIIRHNSCSRTGRVSLTEITDKHSVHHTTYTFKNLYIYIFAHPIVYRTHILEYLPINSSMVLRRSNGEEAQRPRLQKLRQWPRCIWIRQRQSAVTREWP